MKRASNKLMWTLAIGALGGMTGCPGDDGGLPQRSPFRDGWVTEVDQEFVFEDAEGTALIFDLTIGGREENDNFANRGDIIVNFDGPPGRILVEMRRFTFAASEDEAETNFSDLQAWAYTSAPGRPQDQDPEDACIKAAGDSDQSWQNACEFRVYYDGLAQLDRSGADIRVTLPPDYPHKINVFTQDNIEEEDYLNRGHVCMSQLNGTALIETESGKIWASLNREVQEAPTCTPEQITKCEEWTVEDDMGNMVPAPWAPECDCIAVGGGIFGRLEARSREETAADITIDMPAGLWASVKAENTGTGQEAAGDHCDATIEVANFTPNETGNDSPWEAFGNVNYPGPPAIAGAGYSVVATSKSCEPVAFTEHPEDFVGTGKGEDQTSEERGNVKVCTDCIVQSCDELIP